MRDEIGVVGSDECSFTTKAGVHNISRCTHTSRRIDLFVSQLVKIIKLVMAARVRVLCDVTSRTTNDHVFLWIC